jgi:hypothetical protein
LKVWLPWERRRPAGEFVLRDAAAQI